MKRRRRNTINHVVAAVVLVVPGVFGVATVRAGVAEYRDVAALKDRFSDLVAVGGAVIDPPTAAGNSNGGSRQMSVRFTTADGRRVTTRVWTRRDNDDFDKGQRIDLEYVAQRPSAARLLANQEGPPAPWETLMFGVALMAAMILVAVGWLFRLVSGRGRRLPPKDETRLPPSHVAP